MQFYDEDDRYDQEHENAVLLDKEIEMLNEETAMAKYTSDYPINNVTVDAVVIAVTEDLHRPCEVLAITRGQEPHKGALALPGGFLGPEETAIDGAVRETHEETGFNIRADRYDVVSLRPRTEPGRDSRGRTISLPYVFWVPFGVSRAVKGADDAQTAQWLTMGSDFLDDACLRWAFDHGEIMWEAFHKTMDRRFGPGFQWL